MQHTFSLALLLPGLLACSGCGDPAPLDPALSAEQVVAQVLDDAEGVLLANLDQFRQYAQQEADGAFSLIDHIMAFSSIYEDFQVYAARASDDESDREMSRGLGEEIRGAFGYGLLGDLIQAVLPEVRRMEATAPTDLWEVKLSAEDEGDDPEQQAAKIEARLLRPGSGELLAGIDFVMSRTPDGWRVRRTDGIWFGARRFDLEGVHGQTAWRVRREGDDQATSSTLEVSLAVLSAGDLVPDMAHYSRGQLDMYVGREIGFEGGPTLPAEPEAIRAWLFDDPASIDLLLRPADGSTLQDVYHAIDALFAAGVTHLSLDTALR
ncbi:MAG: hypothetical protein H8E31_06180 [Planctomycetes bacterium]|nr:hypothetical protein [Planctomycetota bacterium]